MHIGIRQDGNMYISIRQDGRKKGWHSRPKQRIKAVIPDRRSRRLEPSKTDMSYLGPRRLLRNAWDDGRIKGLSFQTDA